MNDKHWIDDPRHLKWLWRGFLAVLLLTVLVEPFVALHPAFEIEGWFGFNAWYGLLACVALIALAKALSFFLRRDDSYYDRPDDGQGGGRDD